MHGKDTNQPGNMCDYVEYFDLPPELTLTEDKINTLIKMRPQEEQFVKVYGKEHQIPRSHEAFGMDYKFSGTVCKSKPIPGIFKPIRKYLAKKYKVDFDGILVNWYANGKEYIGFHSDDERQIVPNTPVVAVSFGAKRDFLLKNKETKKNTTIELENNTVLVMKPGCQQKYKHSLPKRSKVEEPRVSVTFRKFKKGKT